MYISIYQRTNPFLRRQNTIYQIYDTPITLNQIQSGASRCEKQTIFGM
jgi:hypothetical protein